MRYLDTSILVAALTNESDTEAAQRSIADVPAGTLLVSDWVVTEFSAALAAKSRANKLDDEDRAVASTAFAALLQSALTRLPVTSSHFTAAARLAAEPATVLRAGDALHLAVAADAAATIYTLDKGLHRAALALEVPAVLASSAEDTDAIEEFWRQTREALAANAEAGTADPVWGRTVRDGLEHE